jgi:hypothetical protein
MKRKVIIYYIIIFLIIYLLIGLIFTVLKSNAYYDYLLNQEDIFQKNNQSYWENRCILENNNPSNRGNPWCWDKQGNFYTEKPTKNKWYSSFMWKEVNRGNMIFTMAAWPIHFIGYDLIHFKSITGAWVG